MPFAETELQSASKATVNKSILTSREYYITYTDESNLPFSVQ